MDKKKALKIATATSVAASAFVSVAPATFAASTSAASKAVSAAEKDAGKLKDQYNAKKLGFKKISLTTAQKSYNKAVAEVKKLSKGKTKSALESKLKAVKGIHTYAANYNKALDLGAALATATKNVNDELKKASFNLTEAKKDQTALKTATSKFTAHVKKGTVYGESPRAQFNAKYLTPANKAASDVAKKIAATEAYNKNLKDAQDAVKALDGIKVSTKSEVANAKALVEKAKTAIAKLPKNDKNLASLNAGVKKAEDKIAAAEAEFTDIEKAQVAVTALETAVMELKDQAAIDTAKGLAEQAKAALEKVDTASEKASLASKIDAAETKIKEAQSNLDAAAAKVEAAEKAVTALQDAVKELSNQEQVDAANKLAEAADKAIEVLPSGEKKAELTAKVTEAKTAIKAAQDYINLPVVDSVSAINETSVQVTFPVDTKITAAELAGKTVKVVAGDKEVVATYKADSFKDGKATFTLSGSDKLVDAATYSVKADWANFEGLSFVAKVAATYINKVETVTSKLPANSADSNANLIYFSAKDQYGEDLGLSGKVTNLDVTVKVNGVPLLPSEYVKDLANGNVEINKDLVEGNTVTLSFTNVVNGNTIEVGTLSYLVAKAETEVPTTISNLTAKYSGTAANGHVIGETATEVLASDELTLSVDVKNQFNNPMNQDVRWVVEAGSSKITKADGTAIATTDAPTFTFKAAEAGSVTISAYLLNGQKVSYEVTIGAKKLDTISSATFTGPLYNHEEKKSDALTINTGAVLRASDVKFQVTEAPQGATAADITLVAVQGDTDADKDKVYVKAVTNKPGTYKFKAYVGTAIDAPNAVVASESTITTGVNPTVSTIDVDSFTQNELTAGTEVKKAVTFKNTHGEVVSVDAKDLKIVSTSNMTVKAYGAQDNRLTIGTDQTPVAKLSFEGTDAKSDTVTIVAGSVTKQVVTTTVAAAQLTSFNLDSTSVSVISEDGLDVPTTAADDLVAVSGGDTYKLIPVTFKDQYGNAINVDANQFDVAVTGTAPGTASVVELWNTKTDDTSKLLDNDAAAVKYIAVKADAGDTSQELTLQLRNEDDSANIGQAVKLNVNVQEARKAASFTAPTLATKVTNGIDQTIDVSAIAVKDQYGRDFPVSEIGNEATTADSYKWVVEGQNANNTIDESYDGNDVVLAANDSVAGNEAVTLKLVYTGATEATTDDVVVGSKTFNFTVGSVANSIAKIELEPTVTVANSKEAADGTYNAKTNTVALDGSDADQTVKFTVKAYNADGEEVAINQSTGVVYTVTNDSITNATVDFNGNVATVNSTGVFDADDTFTIKATSLNGKEDTLTVKVADIDDAQAKSGSYYFSSTATGTESIPASEVNQSSTLHVVGVNQFGKTVDVIENGASIRAISVDDNSVVQATATTDGITLTGKALGTTNVRVFLSDGTNLSLPVTVKSVPVVPAT